MSTQITQVCLDISSVEIDRNEVLGVLAWRGKDYPLYEGDNLIGRDKVCEIVLDHKSVSSKHAEIIFQNGKAVIKDLRSSNGTFVEKNSQPGEFEKICLRNNYFPLKDNSKIRFGMICCQFTYGSIMRTVSNISAVEANPITAETQFFFDPNDIHSDDEDNENNDGKSASDNELTRSISQDSNDTMVEEDEETVDNNLDDDQTEDGNSEYNIPITATVIRIDPNIKEERTNPSLELPTQLDSSNIEEEESDYSQDLMEPIEDPELDFEDTYQQHFDQTLDPELPQPIDDSFLKPEPVEMDVTLIDEEIPAVNNQTYFERTLGETTILSETIEEDLTLISPNPLEKQFVEPEEISPIKISPVKELDSSVVFVNNTQEPKLLSEKEVEKIEVVIEKEEEEIIEEPTKASKSKKSKTKEKIAVIKSESPKKDTIMETEIQDTPIAPKKRSRKKIFDEESEFQIDNQPEPVKSPPKIEILDETPQPKKPPAKKTRKVNIEPASLSEETKQIETKEEIKEEIKEPEIIKSEPEVMEPIPESKPQESKSNKKKIEKRKAPDASVETVDEVKLEEKPHDIEPPTKKGKKVSQEKKSTKLAEENSNLISTEVEPQPLNDGALASKQSSLSKKGKKTSIETEASSSIPLEPAESIKSIKTISERQSQPIKIMFTKVEESLYSKQLKKIPNIQITTDATEATHCITTKELKRTPKLMVALNSSIIYILNEQWIIDSAKAGKALPLIDSESLSNDGHFTPSDYLTQLQNSSYIIRDYEKEALWGFEMTQTLSSIYFSLDEKRNRISNKLFQQMVIFCTKSICGKTAPSEEEMSQIVTSGGGVFITNLNDYKKNYQNEDGKKKKTKTNPTETSSDSKYLLLVISHPSVASKEVTKDILETAKASGAVGIYSIEVLFKGVLRQKLNLQEEILEGYEF